METLEVVYSNEDFESLQAFLADTDDLIEAMESNVLLLEDAQDKDIVNSVFRPMHTIKGTTGFLGLPHINRLSHETEFLLDDMRNERCAVSSHLINLLLNSIDMLKLMFQQLQAAIDQKKKVDEGWRIELTPLQYEPIVEAIQNARQAEETQEKREEEVDFTVPQLAREDAVEFIKKVTKGFNLLRSELQHFSHKTSPETLEIALKQLRQAAEAIQFTDLLTELNSLTNVIDFLYNGPEEMHEVMLQSARDSLRLVGKMIDPTPFLNDPGDAEPKKEEKPKDAPVQSRRASDRDDLASIRVPSERLDQFMNLIGELVIQKNLFENLATTLRTKNLNEESKSVKDAGMSVSRIVDELSSVMMTIRMIPVKTVFARFPRMVRDLSNQFDKKAKLVMEGEDTQLDKNVIEKIGDPLVHMIRNSLDHGLETPSEREAAGKSAEGTIRLRAISQSQQVTIQVMDDGKGLHRDPIGRKAIEKGLVSPEELQQMSDSEVYGMIMMPGFSTAEKLTEVSGRGVGMDVVRSNIEAIGGTVSLDSVSGEGTTISMTIPLTLTMTRGFEISCGKERFLLPMENVVETLRVPQSNVRGNGNGLMISYRDQVLPLLRLHEKLGLRPARAEEDMLRVVILSAAQSVYALEVDQVYREIEIVLKPLGVLGQIEGISGAAIQSDGSVCLVLNPIELLNL